MQSPTPDPGGQKVKIQPFQSMGMFIVAYEIKGNQECSNMVANILPAHRPYPNPWEWDQNSTSSEHGHVAYQIKGNHECSNMVAKILPAYTPSPTP